MFLEFCKTRWLCDEVTFQEIPKSWKIDFSSVSRHSFRRNSGQSVRNRCPVIFQPSVYSILMFSQTMTQAATPNRAKKGPYRDQKTEKTGQKMKNRKFKKPYIKVVRDSCLWDSGRWEWWGIILELIPPYYRDIWPYKTSETLIFFLFSQYWGGVQEKSMISSLLQAINSGTILSETASKS